MVDFSGLPDVIKLESHHLRHEFNGADEIAGISDLAVATAQFDKSDTALATVTGLSITLAASSTYRLEADLFVNADATGGHKYALDGTVTVEGIKYEIESVNNLTSQLILAERLTALAGTAGQAGATQAHTKIIGVIASSASGTINVQFAQQEVSGTSSVLTYSSFKAEKM